MAAASSSSSSSSSVVPRKEWTYDVYISFSGEDTRYNFVDHLYTALTMQGIHVFKDEKYLRDTELIISEEFVKAMKESRFTVVVFSKNYAYSSWCLDELSTIIECHKEMGGQKILPVYYRIDPLDVGKQKGEFATAFKKHEDEFRGEMDNVKKWRDALTAAYKLYGLHIFLGNRGESAFLNKIVEVILADKQPRIDALYSSVVPTTKGGWKYDVYISFRGEDTRNNFVDHLYTALTMQGIHVFKEDEMIGIGKDIDEFCMKALKESRFAVVVFSKNYANSSWCLEELSLIMECRNQMGQTVLPVFYDIDPSDVRKQKGEFASAFMIHEDSFRGEVGKVKKWRDALTEAADLRRYDIKSPYARGESACITMIVERILADKQPHGNSRLDVNIEKIRSGYQHVETSVKKIGKLSVYEKKEIGTGSNGTIVLEGTHDARPTWPIAVKRVLKSHHDVASKEIQNLIDSEHHPNIVQYYDYEEDDYFVYIALELCICSLHELILSQTNATVQSQLTKLELESFKVRKPIGYPSPELLKVMRDTVAGLARLHKRRIIHRDLKPQNVLIHKDIHNDSSICAKVSDMGISKRLPADKSSLTGTTGYGSSGWQAPETLRKERQTIAVDLFSLGCLLFFCITGGGHPFGDDINHDRDTNIKKDCKDLSSLVDNIPEAFDLVSKLIHPKPEFRPNAAEVYHHPLFWDPDTRLSFFREASDCVELEDRVPGSVLLTALESIGTVAFGSQWDDKLDSTLLNDLNSGRYRNYKYNKVRDLLRVIRNKLNHYRDLRKDVQAALGEVPTRFEGYFSSRFPKLLMEVYKVLKQYCGEEESLKKYYKKTLD